MKRTEYQRLIKLEDRIRIIATEELGLKCCPVEWDIVPPEKMLEIMAYRSPANISSWKFGRDYEKLKTIYDTVDPSLPYEVVINDIPARAYLMNTNTLAVQVLVMAHVYGHINFFTVNKMFHKSRRDIIELMVEANKRFNEYERIYGVDLIELTVDAGHAIQWHSNPFEDETEEERRKRVYEQLRLKNRPDKAEFADLVAGKKKKFDAEAYNLKLWKELRTKVPVEPVEDILRFIIDNSKILDDWQKDILEILRVEGQYYWPIIKTKHMNEGYATMIHELIVDQLFRENLLTSEEHGQYNYSNSLVKAEHRMSMNPYLIGSAMWKDIKERWDKGRHGKDWLECLDVREKENWDTKDMKGWEKIQDVMETYTDWFFMQDFLTANLVDKLDLYIYRIIETPQGIEYIRTDHSAEDVRQIIVNSFAHSGIPKIDIINGNFLNNGTLKLVHRYAGIPLEKTYTEKTLKHIYDLWGRPVVLLTRVGEREVLYKEDGAESSSPDEADDGDQSSAPTIHLSPLQTGDMLWQDA